MLTIQKSAAFRGAELIRGNAYLRAAISLQERNHVPGQFAKNGKCEYVVLSRQLQRNVSSVIANR